MPQFDFHMHTDSSPDGTDSALTMCEAAIQKGIEHIAITDHLDFPDYETDRYADRVERAWEEMNLAKKETEGQLTVALGIEIGSPLLMPTLTKQILGIHSYDFVLASLHQLGREPDFYFVDFNKVDILKTIDDYFDGILDIVEWGQFSSLAHLTYPFRYIPQALAPADYSRWMDKIDAIMKGLIQKNLSLEINTSGLRKKIGVTSPDLPLIKHYKELGGEMITIGSDAHRATDVGAGIEETIQLAKDVGFKYAAIYKKQKPTMITL